MEEHTTKEKIRVILCRPDEMAEVVEIEDELEAMQALVGGPIQEYMPFNGPDLRYDDMAVICNEEGKLMALPPSRAITDDNGHVMDIIAGPFFICYAPLESERFLSVPPDLEDEFMQKFELPERFYRTDNGIRVVRYEPPANTREAAQER